MGLGYRELREFERYYAEILSLQDKEEVFTRITAAIPRFTGMPISSFGGLASEDRMLLRHTVNAWAFEGMIVPVGAGLGGRVLISRRSAWVEDYASADSITHHFNSQVQAENVNGMVVAPIMHDRRLFGCLYAASRMETGLGDTVASTLQLLADRAATAAVAAERAQRATEVAVAQERYRLAVELHDTVGAALFTIGTGIRRLADMLGEDRSAVERVRLLSHQAAYASDALRGSLRALSAPSEEIALSVALRRDCEAFEERTGVSARLILLTELPALSEAVVDALTRVAREALLNVEKHAKASSVVVSVFTAPGRLVLAVSDDGVGLPAERVAGMGLAVAHERLSRLGGDLLIGAGEDGGVTVQAWAPVKGLPSITH